MHPPQVYPEDYSCILPSHTHAGALYIGNLEAAQNLRTLHKHSIKAVLTAAKGITLNHPKTQIPHVLYVPADDHEAFNLTPYLDRAADFIASALQTTNIMVHCLAGVSRSVSLVIAYLIKHQSHSYQDAYNLIKSRRKIIHPNDGFIQQLKQYDSKVRNSKRSRSPSPQHRYSASPQRQTHSHFISTDHFQHRRNYRTSQERQHYAIPEEQDGGEGLEERYAGFKTRNIQDRYCRHQASLQSPSKTGRKGEGLGRLKRLSSAIVPSSFIEKSIDAKTYYDPINAYRKPSPEKVNTSDIDRKIEEIRKKYQQMSGNPITNYTRLKNIDQNKEIDQTNTSNWSRSKGEEWKRRQYNYLDQYDRTAFKNSANLTGRNFNYQRSLQYTQ